MKNQTLLTRIFLIALVAIGVVSHEAFAAPSVGLFSVWIPKVCPDELRAPGREREWNECFETKQNPEFEKAKQWYEGVLGFTVTSDVYGVFDGVAGRWIQLQMPTQSVQMVLKARSAITDDASFTLALESSDELCDYYQTLVKRGVKLDPKFGTPTRQPWAFEFAVRDPNNQQIVINVPAEVLSRETQGRQSCSNPNQ